VEGGMVCSVTAKQWFVAPQPSAAVKFSALTKILLAWKAAAAKKGVNRGTEKLPTA